MQPTKRARGRLCSRSLEIGEVLAEGPKSAEEALQWALFCVRSMKDNGELYFGVDYAQRLTAAIGNGLVFRRRRRR